MNLTTKAKFLRAEIQAQRESLARRLSGTKPRGMNDLLVKMSKKFIHLGTLNQKLAHLEGRSVAPTASEENA